MLCLFILYLFPVLLHAQDQQKLLEHAYKTHSKKELKQFFDNWHKEIPPISDSEFVKLDTLQKETYRVFEVFYHPELIKNFAGKYLPDTIYPTTKFCILQNKISIYQCQDLPISEADSDSVYVRYINSNPISDSIRIKMVKKISDGNLTHGEKFIATLFDDIKNQKVDSIEDFRPLIHSGNRIPVYTNLKYHSWLVNFLGQPDSSKRIDDTSEECRLREVFLSHFARIFFWRLGFNDFYYPFCERIVFDKTLTKARIDFGFQLVFGQGVLEKKDGKWMLVSSYLTGEF